MSIVEFSLAASDERRGFSATKMFDKDGVYVSYGGNAKNRVLLIEADGIRINLWDDHAAFEKAYAIVKKVDTDAIKEFAYSLLSFKQIRKMLEYAREDGRREGRQEQSRKLRELLFEGDY